MMQMVLVVGLVVVIKVRICYHRYCNCSVLNRRSRPSEHRYYYLLNHKTNEKHISSAKAFIYIKSYLFCNENNFEMTTSTFLLLADFFQHNNNNNVLYI